MSHPLYPFGIEMTAVLAFWVVLSVWQRDRSAPAGIWFAALSVAILAWCVAEILAAWAELAPSTRDDLVFAGVLAVPPLWLAVAAHASGIEIARRVPWFPLVLLAPSAFLYALLQMGPWRSAFLISSSAGSAEGPLFPIWSAYAYALTLVGVLFLLRAAWRWPRRGRSSRVFALALAVLVPLGGNALYLSGVMGWLHDPTPMLVGVALVPLRRAVFGSGLFDVLPVDQRVILRDLPVGLLLADASGSVVEMNPAAESLLGMPRWRVLGRTLEALVATLPDDTPVCIRDVSGARGARCAVIGGLDPGASRPQGIAA